MFLFLFRIPPIFLNLIFHLHFYITDLFVLLIYEVLLTFLFNEQIPMCPSVCVVKSYGLFLKVLFKTETN